MTDIELRLEKDREKLLYLYSRANTKSKKSILAADLFNFSDLNETLFSEYNDEEWCFDTNLIKLANNIGLNINSLFVKEIKENQYFYNRIFSSTLNDFIANSFNPYDRYYGIYQLQKLSKETLIELLFEFFNTYDDDMVKNFKYKLNNSQIIFTDKTWGEIRFFSSLNENLIFVNSLFGFNVNIGTIIAHELGHDFEKSIYDSIGGQKYWNYVDATPCNEVSSSFFEYAFIMYLIENKIFSFDTSVCIQKYLLGLLMYSYDINLLYKIKNFTTNELNGVLIEDEEVVRYAKEMQERINYYNLPSDINNIINFKSSFNYGVGKLFSIYLYEAYKSAPNEFKKEFRNALINYPSIGGINAFKNLGITEDTLVKGEALKKLLRSIK